MISILYLVTVVYDTVLSHLCVLGIKLSGVRVYYPFQRQLKLTCKYFINEFYINKTLNLKDKIWPIVFFSF